MLVYFDSVIVIYAVERLPFFQPRAQARVATLRAAGDAGLADTFKQERSPAINGAPPELVGHPGPPTQLLGFRSAVATPAEASRPLVN